MLSSTFIHAQGIGEATERTIWRQEIRDWHQFRERGSGLRLAPARRATLERTVDESLEAVQMQRADYFASALPARHHWRAVSEFNKLAYLDIETDGGMNADSVTIIGISDGHDVRIYTQGIDLAQFAFECQEFDGFVTFFGGGFDLPMLKRRFPVLERVFADRLHIDLCPLLKTLGYRGGLKSIEHQLGVRRRPETDGLSGMDAVRLWRLFRRGGSGSEEALRLLHLYNEEDVVNMKALLEFALPRLHEACGLPCPAPTLTHTRVLCDLS